MVRRKTLLTALLCLVVSTGCSHCDDDDGCCDDPVPVSLPQAGESLIIRSQETIDIPAWQDAHLGGTIQVTSSGDLTLIVNDSLTLGDEAWLQIEGGKAEVLVCGELSGSALTVMVQAGSEFRLDSSGGTTAIDDLDLYVAVDGLLDWVSADLTVGTLDLQSFGARSGIEVKGTLTADTLRVKDQRDDIGPDTGAATRLDLNHVAPGVSILLTSNGFRGRIYETVKGNARLAFQDVDTNYGGLVEILVESSAVVDADRFRFDSSGGSHDILSSGTLTILGSFLADVVEFGTAGTLYTYEDETTSGGPPTWLVTFPMGALFRIVNEGTTNFPPP